ncbi:hypothetical protein B0T09DRAFT_386271 [Sordaria sp. MPI-SDFR-AT-0083]|nr:hypothetical protein B0T09DRAFT_386271 [Sordaria sp. MPI-SDFR-AT-0083]
MTTTTSPPTAPKKEFPKTISTVELHPTFGAEILGVKWGDDGTVSEEQPKELRDAYGFIVLRRNPLTDATHVSFSRLFASAFPSLSASASGPDGDSSPGQGENVLDSITRFIPPPPAPAISATTLTSSSSMPVTSPTTAPLFWTLRLTAREDLGEEEVKRRMVEKEYWTGVYNAAHSRKMGAPDFFKELDVEVGPMLRHKVVQEHVESGRKNLCVGAYLWRLEDKEGNTVPGSKEMIKFLNEHVAQDKYVTSVRWE